MQSFEVSDFKPVRAFTADGQEVVVSSYSMVSQNPDRFDYQPEDASNVPQEWSSADCDLSLNDNEDEGGDDEQADDEGDDDDDRSPDNFLRPVFNQDFVHREISRVIGNDGIHSKGRPRSLPSSDRMSGFLDSTGGSPSRLAQAYHDMALRQLEGLSA